MSWQQQQPKQPQKEGRNGPPPSRGGSSRSGTSRHHHYQYSSDAFNTPVTSVAGGAVSSASVGSSGATSTHTKNDVADLSGPNAPLPKQEQQASPFRRRLSRDRSKDLQHRNQSNVTLSTSITGPPAASSSLWWSSVGSASTSAPSTAGTMNNYRHPHAPNNSNSTASSNNNTPLVLASAMTSLGGHPMPTIFAAPTTDTFGDESTLYFGPTDALLPSQQQGDSVLYHHHQSADRVSNTLAPQMTTSISNSMGSTGGASAAATAKVAPFRGGGARAQQRQPPVSSSATPTARSAERQHQSRSAATSATTTISAVVKKHGKRQRLPNTLHRDFQHKHDVPSVMVQNVSLVHRSAFDWRPAPTVESWRAAVHEAMLAAPITTAPFVSASSSSSSVTNPAGSIHRNKDPSTDISTTLNTTPAATATAAWTSAAKRISPSLQHLQLIHAMQQQTVLRQVHFAPSVSADSDCFLFDAVYGWDDDDDDDDNDDGELTIEVEDVDHQQDGGMEEDAALTSGQATNTLRPMRTTAAATVVPPETRYLQQLRQRQRRAEYQEQYRLRFTHRSLKRSNRIDEADEDGEEDDHEIAADHQKISSKKQSQPPPNRNGVLHFDDGRYRAVHPLRAQRLALWGQSDGGFQGLRRRRRRRGDNQQQQQQHLPPPQLTNKKVRLPMRSDVGFAGATQDEIEQKQREIVHETLWEESSPRLILLVTSDDLGVAVQLDDDDHDHRDGPTQDPHHLEEPDDSSKNKHDGYEEDEDDEQDGDEVLDLPDRNRQERRRHQVQEQQRRQRLPLSKQKCSNKKKLSLQHWSWNGGGLEGMPYAGKEMIQAYLLNSRHFSRPSRVVCASALSSDPPVARGGYDSAPSTSMDLLARLASPNPYSMLAPPLDSSYSPSQGWRPRPYQDRPAGMKYVLACPVQVKFDVGDFEPLLCSLALYCLPPQHASTSHKSLSTPTPTTTSGAGSGGSAAIMPRRYGKMSEDFWFPAGDWHGKISLEAVRTDDPSVDESLEQVWLRRNHKALFSYDPLDLHDRRALGCRQSLHVVVQVYKAAHPGLAKPYVVGGGGGSNAAHASNKPVDREVTAEASDRVFREFGMQLLAPLCVGVFQLFPPNINIGDGRDDDDGDMEWPNGGTRDCQLYLHSPVPESQDTFLERLISIQQYATNYSAEQSDEAAGGCIRPSTAMESSNETPKKRGVVGRIFRTPIKQSGRSRSTGSGIDLLAAPGIIHGRASFFVSDLGEDLLQCMLVTPAALENGVGAISSPIDQVLPKILVDVSGDLAVMLEREETESALPASTQHAKKRSNLIRIPLPSEPVLYAGTSEYREVLYLPCRPEKHFYYDVPPSYRSLLNLMYVYPKQLRLSSDAEDSTLSNFTIRMRAIQMKPAQEVETGFIAPQLSILPLFHNPCPWEGQGLISTVYTRTARDFSAIKTADLRNGVPMSDELKLRLPDILDGSYSLHFTLMSVESPSVPDCEVRLVPIAEHSIPLCSASSRDPHTGARVALVIPNGHHRLRLGDFQLQLETRLVSSIHLGDPGVAVSLLNFPCEGEQGADDEDVTDDNTTKNPDATVRPPVSASMSMVSLSESRDSVRALLASSSESAVMANFSVLLFMNMRGLINQTAESKKTTNPAFLMSVIKGTFEVIKKAKGRILADAFDSIIVPEPLLAFIKKQIDSLEEGSLSPRSKQYLTSTGSSEAQCDSGLDLVASRSDSHDDGISLTAKRDLGSASVQRRGTWQSAKSEQRVSRVVGSLGATGIPFSRQAYGASKMDRLKLEAELRTESSQLGLYFDDDETITTSYSAVTDVLGNKRLLLDHVGEVSRKHFNSSGGGSDNNSILRQASNSNVGKERTEETADAAGGGEFVQRVRTFAKVMLAPCVGPSLASIIASGRPSPRKSPEESERTSGETNAQIPAAKFPNSSFCCSPSSDVEDEIVEETYYEMDSSNSSMTRTFRGLPDGPKFIFTASRRSGHEFPIARGDYLYESVMVLWLSAWLDYVQGALSETLDTSSLHGRQVSTFPIPEYRALADREESIFAFYSHMDFLLPACLKSIVLRYTVEVSPVFPVATKVLIDDSHKSVFDSFVEVLARGLIGQGLSGLGSAHERENAMIRSLESCDLVLDFLIGLLSILHAEHMNELLAKFFKTLRDSETEHLGDSITDLEFSWTEESLHRVRCSRQLRMRSIERLAVIPCFLALNYPPKYSGQLRFNALKKSSWMHQYNDNTTDPEILHAQNERPDGLERLPVSGWLAVLLLKEGLSVCALSCEAVVAEAMAHIEVTDHVESRVPQSALKKRPGAALKRVDLLMFQGIAIQAICTIYELVLRRHAIDQRFQANSARERIAGLYTLTILDKSIASVRWLARMEMTHKVRAVWLLCFVYVLQEAPEAMIREYVRSACSQKNVQIHRFIRLLRLCSSTFQGFVDSPRSARSHSAFDKVLSPWLLQESFNTICAATNIVVEECASQTSGFPHEQSKILQGILDLLLHMLTTPHSCVTHLRALGGALQALEHFGADLFLEITGHHLQHWLRVILALMNSISLSVRSIAVDFVVSLLGSTFDLHGSIDMIGMICASVLPEVAAREIALYSVSGNISTIDDVSKALWPLRRSFADLEDTSPLDDDRVDPQLAPAVSVFCRTCQAIIDGVLIEIMLKGDRLSIVGVRVASVDPSVTIFDAQEESLFEASSFFVPETSPMQKIRWLLTLKSLHESKEQWVEAAETLFLCAETISDSIPHLVNVWRPSRFALWSDIRRSLWLGTVGEDLGHPDRGNAQVVDFADHFLEPGLFTRTSIRLPKVSPADRLLQPTASIMCEMLSSVAKEAVDLYLKEGGTDELAYGRLESLQRRLIRVLDCNTGHPIGLRGPSRSTNPSFRKRRIEEEASLRRVLATISADMTRLAERLLILVRNETTEPALAKANDKGSASYPSKHQVFFVVNLSGRKPDRFVESTTVPTFLDWNTPCICRVPATLVGPRGRDEDEAIFAMRLGRHFAQPYLEALQRQCGDRKVIFKMEPLSESAIREDRTYLNIFPAEAVDQDGQDRSLRRFFYRKNRPGFPTGNVVEMTVAHSFPCALSRQRSLLTTEIVPTTPSSSSVTAQPVPAKEYSI